MSGSLFKKRIKLPHRALTDKDLSKFFRGVYMRNDLPKSGPLKYESAIVNLDDKDGSGTNWVAHMKRNNE